jgi:hypothetical protein
LLVESCKLEEAEPLAGETDAGEKAQVAPAGNPEQLRLTAPGKFPPNAVAVTV